MTTFTARPYANLGTFQAASVPRRATLSAEATDRLSRALGQAIVHCWSRLPRDLQHELFEAAVTAEGEAIRLPLAIHLHGVHVRTVVSLQARAMPEPDSLGG